MIGCMSAHAKGADAPVQKRITVGLTEEEATSLGIGARRYGLSLSRYLVECAVRTPRLTTIVAVPRANLKSPTSKERVVAVFLDPRLPSRLSLKDPPCSEAYRCEKGGRATFREKHPVGRVIVWRCESGRYRVARVGLRDLEDVRWLDSPSEADDYVEAIRGR